MSEVSHSLRTDYWRQHQKELVSIYIKLGIAPDIARWRGYVTAFVRELNEGIMSEYFSPERARGFALNTEVRALPDGRPEPAGRGGRGYYLRMTACDGELTPWYICFDGS